MQKVYVCKIFIKILIIIFLSAQLAWAGDYDFDSSGCDYNFGSMFPDSDDGPVRSGAPTSVAAGTFNTGTSLYTNTNSIHPNIYVPQPIILTKDRILSPLTRSVAPTMDMGMTMPMSADWQKSTGRTEHKIVVTMSHNLSGESKFVGGGSPISLPNNISIPTGIYTFADGYKFDATNTATQTNAYLNEVLIQSAQGNEPPLPTYRSEKPAYVYGATQLGAELGTTVMYMRGPSDFFSVNFYNGPFMRPGDTIYGYNNDYLSGIGADTSTHRDIFYANYAKEYYRLQINDEGNISPIVARQIIPPGALRHTTKGVWGDIWSTPQHTLQAQDIAEIDQIPREAEIVWDGRIKKATPRILISMVGAPSLTTRDTFNNLIKEGDFNAISMPLSRTEVRILDRQTGKVLNEYNSAGLLEVDDKTGIVNHKVDLYMPHSKDMDPSMPKLMNTLQKLGFILVGSQGQGVAGTFWQFMANIITASPTSLKVSVIAHELAHAANSKQIPGPESAAFGNFVDGNDVPLVKLDNLGNELFFEAKERKSERDSVVNPLDKGAGEKRLSKAVEDIRHMLTTPEQKAQFEKAMNDLKYVYNKNFQENIKQRMKEGAITQKEAERQRTAMANDEVFAFMVSGLYGDSTIGGLSEILNKNEGVRNYVKGFYKGYLDFPDTKQYTAYMDRSPVQAEMVDYNTTKGRIIRQEFIGGKNPERWLLVHFDNLDFRTDGRARFFEEGAEYSVPYASGEDPIVFQRVFFEAPNSFTTLGEIEGAATGAIAPDSLSGVLVDPTSLQEGAYGKIYDALTGAVYQIFKIDVADYPSQRTDTLSLRDFTDVRRQTAVNLGTSTVNLGSKSVYLPGLNQVLGEIGNIQPNKK